jgi:hypothetical protein
MFLAPKINKCVASLYHDMSSREVIGHDELRQVFQKAVKPLGVRVVIRKEELPKRAFAIGGFYEIDRVRQPVCIELFVSQKSEEIRVTKKWLANTAFVLYQTLSHELIHKYQYKGRDNHPCWIIDLDDRVEMDEQQAYLAELDEIDAYAHDIALELAFYHPDTCMDELRTMQSPKITSWTLYTESFEGTSWREIHNRLLKKVYKHLSQIREYSEEYSCTKMPSA